jgi:hypothetical protein
MPENPLAGTTGHESFEIKLDRAGTREAAHPTRPEIRLLSPDFYADPDPLYT